MSDEPEIQGQATAVMPEPSEQPEVNQVHADPSPAPDGVLGAFRTLPDFEGADDRQIASRLFEAFQREKSATAALAQYQSIIPYASEYLSNKPRYEQWLASQQTKEEPQQKPEPKWWNPPEIRDAYRQYLVRDEQGREVISPDAPLDAKHALYEHQQYKADFAKKLLSDPESTLAPMIQKVAEQRAQDIVSTQLDALRRQSFVSELEQKNADWLYDEKGNVSREGLACQKYIEDARAMGIQSPEARWQFAISMVERDLLSQNIQSQAQLAQRQQAATQKPTPIPPANQTPEPPSLAQRNMEYLRQMASRNPSQSTPQTTDQRVPKPNMTFEQRLKEQLRSDGLV